MRGYAGGCLSQLKLRHEIKRTATFMEQDLLLETYLFGCRTSSETYLPGQDQSDMSRDTARLDIKMKHFQVSAGKCHLFDMSQLNCPVENVRRNQKENQEDDSPQRTTNRVIRVIKLIRKLIKNML